MNEYEGEFQNCIRRKRKAASLSQTNLKERQLLLQLWVEPKLVVGQGRGRSLLVRLQKREGIVVVVQVGERVREAATRVGWFRVY